MVAVEGLAFTPTEASRGRSNPTRDDLSTSVCAVTTLEMAIGSGMEEIVAGKEMNMCSMNKSRRVIG